MGLINHLSIQTTDFSFMFKPVIYYQFIPYHYKDEFDYKNEGFGEQTANFKKLIYLLENYLKKNCEIEDIFKKRIKAFFEYIDDKNCLRIYNEIKKYN